VGHVPPIIERLSGSLYFVKRREGINKCDAGESYFMESWDLEHHFASEVVLLIGGDGSAMSCASVLSG
jgi:hypothetical protein